MGNQKNKDKRFDKSYIENKDILNTSWLYFQQHAQQRISYFNFFVAFSTLLTTGMISTFQGDFKNHYIGIFLGITQAFLSVIFLKIDKRNKELTKHGENIIKKIERTYYKDKSLRLFSIEENETEKKRNQERKKYPCIWCKRGMSHGKAFLHIFWAFFIIGLIGAMISLYMLFYVDENTNTNNKTIELNYYQNNIYHNDHIKMDDNIPDVKSTEDTINNIHKKIDIK